MDTRDRPGFRKISHLSFSARDAEDSASWWAEVMGFEELERVRGDGWTGIVMVHPSSGTVIEFQQHDANQGEPFDPARTGLDHVGLLVDDPSDLEAWREHFEALGVTHTPPVHREYGSVLTFKDPDLRQVEVFYRPDHP